MQNFDYLKEIKGLTRLHSHCDTVERLQVSDPEASALAARKALEWIVNIVYRLNDEPVPERADLFGLTTADTFRDFIADTELMKAVHYIRKVGNQAAHDGHVTAGEAFFSLLNIYNVVGGILLKLGLIETLVPFDRSLIPGGSTQRSRRPRIHVGTRHGASASSESINPSLKPEDRKEMEKFAATVPKEAVKVAPAVVPKLDWSDISEAETRRTLIDIMLREAGWEVSTIDGAKAPAKACVEVCVGTRHGASASTAESPNNMPNGKGVGYADYVLFGPDMKPLAVIEAKRTSVNPLVGEQQASLYADALEREYGVRPVIYLSNGYTTWIIDGLGYPKRNLYAFHTLKDLELLHQRRNRREIADMSVKDEITNRHYQKSAIKAMCEHFNRKHRRGLVVMATGTGKTRTAISLVDVLTRHDWIKSVLFLADRNSLVTQAKRAFNKHLPYFPIADLTQKTPPPDMDARLMFSTYQTMINYVDSQEKPFSVGRFDLIIIDEAHRSVFGKYGAIFNYFDSLLVGLTATPRDQVDKSTYDLLELEGGIPNFAYELDEAIEDEYLVPYRAYKRNSELLKEGIKYSQLTEEEREQLEKVWKYEQANGEPGEPHDLPGTVLYKYLFNVDTVDQMLQDLMENGLMVQSGEKIGKTIIFAFNTQHAEQIVKRFNVLYPQYGNEFCRQIDYSVNYYQSLIDNFSQTDSLPQIAVSVDMLDTGIDVTDILNLVIFKRVRSRIKFMQMLGRGTRLHPDVFGPGHDKKEFYIFDYCGNFDWFEMNPPEAKQLRQQSLTERIFGIRADIAYTLQAPEYQADEFAKGFCAELKETLKNQTTELSDDHISVRNHWEAVNHFRNPKAWEYVKSTDVLRLKEEVAPLIHKDTDDENAKKFDLLALGTQLGLIDSSFNASGHEAQIRLIAEELRKKATIPAIQAKMPLLDAMLTARFWEEDKSLASLEDMRRQVRELMKFLTAASGQTFEVDIKDTITDGGESTGFSTSVTYREKVLEYISRHSENPVLTKIRNLEQLTSDDIGELEKVMWENLGTKEDYRRFLQRENLADSCGESVAAFLRALLDLDRAKALAKFTEFISANSLTAEQEEYLKCILDYVNANGDISTNVLTNESPFDDMNPLEIFPDNLSKVADFVDFIHNSIIAA